VLLCLEPGVFFGSVQGTYTIAAQPAVAGEERTAFKPEGKTLEGLVTCEEKLRVWGLRVGRTSWRG
jgi:hypothetical protein